MKMLTSLLLLALFFTSYANAQDQDTIKKVTFVLTNDIHGHLEPKVSKKGAVTGGMAFFSTYMQALRAQPEYQTGQSGLFLIDSGDQFQGTLVSNYDEGKTVFKTLNLLKYDAAIPGNHDYDFGPLGWLYDQVVPGVTGNDPRQVIKKLSRLAKFPLLSANTYLKRSISIRDTGQHVELDSQCKPTNQSVTGLSFDHAVRPSFLRPFKIIRRAGVRVAFIGIDHHLTAQNTTAENVSDLCFRDEVDQYIETRLALQDRADIFVLVMHNGNSDSKDASDITHKINLAFPHSVDLVAAGHTHYVHNDVVDDIHVIQDGSGGDRFGLVNIYWNATLRKVVSEKTESASGITIEHDHCVNNKFPHFCDAYPVPLASDPRIQTLIDAEKVKVAPLANQVLGTATEEITRERIMEGALGNLLTDSLRASANADVALMNSGGIRENIAAGKILYNALFEVLPFNNQAVLIQNVKWESIRNVLEKSIQSCGSYGVMDESGLTYQYSRNCKSGDVDLGAKLLHVETLFKEVLFDSANAIEVDATRNFKVVTLDFIASGGAGYDEFSAYKDSKVLGIARELIAKQLSEAQPTLGNTIDHRMTLQH